MIHVQRCFKNKINYAKYATICMFVRLKVVSYDWTKASMLICSTVIDVSLIHVCLTKASLWICTKELQEIKLKLIVLIDGWPYVGTVSRSSMILVTLTDELFLLSAAPSRAFYWDTWKDYDAPAILPSAARPPSTTTPLHDQGSFYEPSSFLWLYFSF